MAWAEVAVAATDRMGNRPYGKVVLAALALHGGLAPVEAVAETAPEHGVVSLRYLRYKDQQDVKVRYPDYNGSEPSKFERVTAKSPSLHVVAPVGTTWTIEASAVYDDVSGATPRYYSDVSGATPKPGMEDKRTAGDVRISKHFSRGGVSVGVSHSSEDDYRSTAVSVEGRVATPDNNTTFTLGVGHSEDKINPTNDAVDNEAKRTNELIVGVTQALSPNDLVQLNATYAQGEGYYSDPYKRFDNRPDRRKQAAALVRWNHFVNEVDATVRAGYRYYQDSFGIAAHTFEASWVQPVSSWLWITPSARYYTQSAADFYYDPVMDANYYPRPLVPQTFSTADQRMSAFGAVTVGIKAEVRWADWTTDLKYERYEQRSDWRSFGKGSPNIDTFSADSVQIGVSRKF